MSFAREVNYKIILKTKEKIHYERTWKRFKIFAKDSPGIRHETSWWSELIQNVADRILFFRNLTIMINHSNALSIKQGRWESLQRNTFYSYNFEFLRCSGCLETLMNEIDLFCLLVRSDSPP